jgi:hypothetical protein
MIIILLEKCISGRAEEKEKKEAKYCRVFASS